MQEDITSFLIYDNNEKVFFHLVEFLGPAFSIMREKKNRQKKTLRKCRG
jgi:hypothetical protein